MTENRNIKPITAFLAVFPIAFVLLFALLGVLLWSLAIEWILIISTIVVAGIAYWQGYRWKDIEKALSNKIAEAWLGALILMLVGAIVGTWMFSGTVPMLIYYGIKWLDPRYVPITAFIVTALVSLFTGTSWGSAATSGIAFMGVAQAVNAPLPIVAGAIISGAYLGDKNSPVSDTTVLAAIGANTPLYKHVNSMLRISIPAVAISIPIYLVLGFAATDISIDTVEATQNMLRNLSEIYNFNILLLIPALLVFGGAIRRFPPVPLLLIGSLSALLLGVIFQGYRFSDGVTAMISGFKISMSPVDPNSVVKELGGLLNRGGISSMMGSVLFISCSMSFGALLQLNGSLNKLLELLSKAIYGTTSLIIITWVLSLIINSSVSSAQFTFLTLGPILRETYNTNKLHRATLSRTMEEGATITEPLIPWTVTGIYMASILGIPNLQFAPFAIYNLACIVIMFIYAFIPQFKLGTPRFKEETV